MPFEIDSELMSVLQSIVTVILGESPSGFRELLAGPDEIDRL